jgi:imidazolonepropionase
MTMLDAPSHTYLAYRPGVPQIAAVWQAGTLVAGMGLAAAAAGP